MSCWRPRCRAMQACMHACSQHDHGRAMSGSQADMKPHLVKVSVVRFGMARRELRDKPLGPRFGKLLQRVGGMFTPTGFTSAHRASGFSVPAACPPCRSCCLKSTLARPSAQQPPTRRRSNKPRRQQLQQRPGQQQRRPRLALLLLRPPLNLQHLQHLPAQHHCLQLQHQQLQHQQHKHQQCLLLPRMLPSSRTSGCGC